MGLTRHGRSLVVGSCEHHMDGALWQDPVSTDGALWQDPVSTDGALWQDPVNTTWTEPCGRIL
jgi:hypothetical protein